MKGFRLASAAVICLVVLTAASVRAASELSFEQAMAQVSKKVEGVIEARKQNQGKFGVASVQSSAGTTEFKLDLNESGQGQAETKQTCFGVTLKCVGIVEAPESVYDLKVSTDGGSEHVFKNVPNGKELTFELKTKSGFGKTTFFVELVALDKVAAQQALLKLAYSF